jgi:uncharacterized protein YndB with AHSA1/START domain
MSHYRKSLVLDAPPAAVYAALTTPEGLRGWWTEDCDVATDVGGTIRLRFGRTVKDMRIEHLDQSREVRWRCTAAHIAAAAVSQKDEWVGTQIAFRLADAGAARTRVEFEHVGLVPALQCYGLCSDGWDHYLRSLQQFVATGEGTPYELATASCAG